MNFNNLVDFVDSIAPVVPSGEEFGDLTAAKTLIPPGGTWTRVAFSAGRHGLLDLTTERGTVWLQVLDSLHKNQTPAYVEIDSVSTQITKVLIPNLVTIGEITPTAENDGVEVELIISHAKHYLRSGHPQFNELLARLKAAQADRLHVAVTEDPTSHEIIEVTVLTGDRGLLPGEPQKQEPETSVLGNDMWGLAAIPLSRVQRLFDLMNSRVCCPSGATRPCIPFDYPDDGCWGRAHEMYRLMANEGVQANKVWIFGNLRAATTNNPRCEVRWGWHVAPTVMVNTGGRQEIYVIDPSLFPGPVTQATWAGVQGDPGAALISSAGSVFYRNRSGTVVQTDASYSETNRVLDTYRNQLRIRAVGSDGPPPYLSCLPGKAGVQFYGTIAPGATHTWFTFGWPARWHVVWTVMPLTTCPGAPQLKCRTRVERSDTNNATYWIVVTNTSSATVRFEGRYDILSR